MREKLRSEKTKCNKRMARDSTPEFSLRNTFIFKKFRYTSSINASFRQDKEKGNLRQHSINVNDMKLDNHLHQIKSKNSKTIHIFSTSHHGKNVSSRLNSNHAIKAYSSLYPNAPFELIMKQMDCPSSENLGLILGAEQVCEGKGDLFFLELVGALEKCKDCNLLLSTIPPRYDLPYNSRENKDIRIFNKRICDILNSYDNLYLVDSHNLQRDCFTPLGLHLNGKGQSLMAQKFNDVLVFLY